MDRVFFESQIKRLAELHGARHYREPRVNELFNALYFVEDHVFKNAVSYLLANQFYVPLLKEIREAINHVREVARAREHAIAKGVEKKEAKAFFTGELFTDEDIKWNMEQIKKRLAGKMSDEEWASYKEVMRETMQKKEFIYKCNECADEGVIELSGVTYKCARH